MIVSVFSQAETKNKKIIKHFANKFGFDKKECLCKLWNIFKIN